MMDLSEVTDRVKDLTGYETADVDAPMTAEGDPVVEFVCKDDHYGAIPEPKPANRVLPDWYRELPQRMSGNGERKKLQSSTVKRCAPFLDALTMGWIIPLAANVEIFAQDGNVNYNWEFEDELITSHHIGQVGGDAFPNNDWPILKFNNKWCVKVPDGYSLLVTQPFNRVEPRFQTFSGLIDADNYFNFINAPFMWTGGEYEGIIEAGTPIVQVIPIKRDAMLTDGIARPMDDEERTLLERTKRRLEVEESSYRNDWWVHKQGTRMLPYEEDTAVPGGS